MKAKRHALAQRREIVGHTQETLAEFVGVEPTTIGRWERGKTFPQPWSRPKLADALAVSLEELDILLAEGQPTKTVAASDTSDEPVGDPEHDLALSAPWSHRGTVEVAVVLRGGDRPVKRRGFVFLTGIALTAPAHQWLIHEPGPLVSGLSGRRVSAELVDRFMAMIPELRAMDDVAGGGTVLSLAEHEFGVIADLLDQASYGEPTGRKLHVALAELGQLAGWSAYDVGKQALAQRYYIAALRAAHSADDRPLGAHVLSCMAEQAAHEGQPSEAVTLIESAFAGARGQATPRLLAELYIRQAYALGTMHDVSACSAAVSKARAHVEPQDDDPPWLYWVSPADITAFAGDCLLQLGQAHQAAKLIEEGVDLFDESFARDRQIYSVHLADALTRPGTQRDLAAAASRGIAAIQLAEVLDSNRSVDLLRDLCHQMKPHAKVPAVRKFLDRARGLVLV
ncbi:MAG: helix-turn-helix transcriptional regulator [Pseudonocardiaceae bacterium]